MIHLDSAFANASNCIQVKIQHEMEKASFKHIEMLERLLGATKLRPRRVPKNPEPTPPQPAHYEVDSGEEEIEVDE